MAHVELHKTSQHIGLVINHIIAVHISLWFQFSWIKITVQILLFSSAGVGIYDLEQEICIE